LFVRIFAEEPVHQLQIGADLSTPSPLEGRHYRVQLSLEVTFRELREEVKGSALGHIIVVGRFYKAAQELKDA